MRTSKTRRYFSSLFETRKPATEARVLADQWAERTIRHLDCAPRIHAVATPRGVYLAIMHPIFPDSYRTFFRTPAGTECAISSGDSSTPEKTWANHLAHFSDWLPAELLSPRD